MSSLPPPTSTPVGGPAARSSRARIDPILLGLFGAALAALLIGLVLTADLTVAASEKTAEITDIDRTARREDGVTRYSYSVRGVDEDGSTFRTGVSESAHARASVGDTVTIERSSVSGRVVTITADGWSKSRSMIRLTIAVALALGGLALAVGTLRAARREMRAAAEQGEPLPTARRNLALVSALALAVTVAWVQVERSIAS